MVQEILFLLLSHPLAEDFILLLFMAMVGKAQVGFFTSHKK